LLKADIKMSKPPASIPIWAAIPTPFLESLTLNEAGIRHNVRHYMSLGLDGVFCNGLVGEVWSLSLGERQRIVEIIADEAKGELALSVEITSGSIPETLELGLHAKCFGAAHSVLMVPTSGPRSDEQLLAYFRGICETLDMPIVIFNAGAAAGSPLKPEVFAALCGLPGVVMLKTTSYLQNAELRESARNGVLVSDPLEEHFLSNHRDHGQSILYADPEPFLYQTPQRKPIAAYIEHLNHRDILSAQNGFKALSPFRKVFNEWIMEPLIAGHMPNAAIKHWCESIGMAGGPVRAPIKPLTADEKRVFDTDLENAHRLMGMRLGSHQICPTKDGRL
jgi:4-hydroxy-tetrahydrodipicolinate synthase